MTDKVLDDVALEVFKMTSLPPLTPRERQRSWTALKGKYLASKPPGSEIMMLREAIISYFAEELHVDKARLEASPLEALQRFLEIYFGTLHEDDAKEAKDAIGAYVAAISVRLRKTEHMTA
eukprot:PhF_6_TR37926/c0_g1_i1/m.56674